MAKRTNKKRSDEVVASHRGSSAVAVSAFLRTGAGKHGAQGQARHRQDRKQTRQALRRGDWD